MTAPQPKAAARRLVADVNADADALAATLAEFGRAAGDSLAGQLDRRTLFAVVDLDTAAYDDVYRALQTQHRVDQRTERSLFVKLAVTSRRLQQLGKQRSGDHSLFGQLVDLGSRVLDRVRHSLAPSSAAGASAARVSVGDSPAPGLPSDAGDDTTGGAR